VDLRRFRQRPRQPAGGVTIAMVSRLDPGKFPRQLLAYLPDLRALDARLLIAGRGARRHEIAPEIAARGLTGIIQFAGVIPSRRIPEFLAAADIGLHLTEIEQENCSVAVLEMLASGLPVVSQPKGCLPEMVTHGVNGYLAHAPGAIAGHLAELISSPRLRARMGASSRQRAQPFRIERYRTQMRTLVARTLAAPPYVVIGRADNRRTYPEDVSLVGWRPRQTFLIYATRGAEADLLSEALASTGVAGVPRPFHLPSSTRVPWRWNATLERELRRHLEACATPNGVTGAVLSAGDIERLLESQADLPHVRLIRITRRRRVRRAIPSTEGERASDARLARLGIPLIRVFYRDLLTRRRQTTDSIVRQLGISVTDVLDLRR
jgi:hypothetical protein